MEKPSELSDSVQSDISIARKATYRNTRAELLWRVAVFQLKLMVDGIRDVLLVPVSLIAGLIGVMRGGNDADRYFMDIVQLGRRTEHWINLFGQQAGKTSDQLIEPLQERVFAKLERNPGIQQDGADLGQQLDKIMQQRKTAIDLQGTGSDGDPSRDC